MSISITTSRSLTPYMRKDDLQMYRAARANAPCPAVWWLDEESMLITREWQFYLRAINYGMGIQYVSALLDNSKAVTNKNGFPKTPDEPRRANYIRGEDLDTPLPKFTKVFTFSRGIHLGRRVGNNIVFFAMDGTKKPAIKPGKSQPMTIDEATPDRYLYVPETHRFLFTIANNVKTDGAVEPFPNGAIYSFTGDNSPYSFYPFVADHEPVDRASNWIELATGIPYPSPYMEL